MFVVVRWENGKLRSVLISEDSWPAAAMRSSPVELWPEYSTALVRVFKISKSQSLFFLFSGEIHFVCVISSVMFPPAGSPCYPAQTYGRDRRYWRKYIQFDFNEIRRLATQEIIRTRWQTSLLTFWIIMIYMLVHLSYSHIQRMYFYMIVYTIKFILLVLMFLLNQIFFILKQNALVCCGQRWAVLCWFFHINIHCSITYLNSFTRSRCAQPEVLD